MSQCITLRSKTDARITGWHVGGHVRCSTDHKRQKLFDQKRDARRVCHELRSLCPHNAKVTIEAAQDDPSLDVVPLMFSPSFEVRDLAHPIRSRPRSAVSKMSRHREARRAGGR